MLPSVTVRKRYRPTLVCLNCRRRKTKCDREKPACGNCVKIGETCFYSEHAEENAVKKVKYTYVEDLGLPEIINMTPRGFKISVKRSAAWFNGLFSDIAIIERDPYLTITDEVVDILFETMRNTFDRRKQDYVLTLPNSLKIITTYNSKPQPSEEMLFHQIAKEFSAIRSAPVEDIYIPDQKEFWTRYYPHFTGIIHPLLPIFDLEELKSLIQKFFDHQTKEPGVLNEKAHESTILMTIYLIVNLYLMEFDSRNMTIQKNINLIKGKIMNYKWFQKTTLFQIRTFLLLRFHNWCSYHDNDGSRTNANDGLMGLIMGHCNSLGTTWQLWTNIDKPEFRIIWAAALNWDRKLALLTGSDPLNTRTMKVPELPDDYLVIKFLKCCIDDPNKLDYTLAMDTLGRLTFEKEHRLLQWELRIVVLMAKLSLHHGKLNHSNTGIIAIIRVIEELITIWNEYFETPLLPISYSRRIVELSMNKALVILPAIILRVQDPHKHEVIQLMNKLSTTYFNEFPRFYHVFKRLFIYKLTFNLVSRQDSLNHLIMILKHERPEVLEKMGIFKDHADMTDEDLIKAWNNKYRHVETPCHFKVDIKCKEYQSNLYSSSYQNTIEKLEKTHTVKSDTIDVAQFLQQVFDLTEFDRFYDIDIDVFPKFENVLY